MANLTPVVRLYASNTGQVDSDSIVLGESSVKSNQINPGKAVNVNVTADFLTNLKVDDDSDVFFGSFCFYFILFFQFLFFLYY